MVLLSPFYVLLVLGVFSFLVQRRMRHQPAPQRPYTKLGCFARIKTRFKGAPAEGPAEGEAGETPEQAEAFNKAMESWLMWQSLRARDIFVSLAVVGMFMIHSSTAKFVFGMFKCTTTGAGVSHLKANMHVRCGGDEHYAIISSVAAPCLILWVVGIPLTLYVLLQRNQKEIQATVEKASSGANFSQSMDEGRASQGSKAEATKMLRMNARYSYLFKGYEARHFMWELVVMMRKLALLAGVVFFADPDSHALQAWWVLMVVSTSLVSHMAYSPFVDTVQHVRDAQGNIVRTTTNPWLDYLERLSLIFSLALFSGGQLLFMPPELVADWVKVACTLALSTIFAAWPVVCWSYFAVSSDKVPASLRDRAMACCRRFTRRTAAVSMRNSELAHGVELVEVGSNVPDDVSDAHPANNT